jgi:hypothetical protein
MAGGELEGSSKAGAGKPKRTRRKPRKWTGRRVEDFVSTLDETGNVSAAIRACGMSRDAVYNRRKADPDFRRRWEQALLGAYDALEARALDEGLNGKRVKIRYRGEVVDEEVHFDTRTALTLLRMHRDTAERVRAQADAGPQDRDALERELIRRLDLMEARLSGAPEPGADDAAQGC